jgi:MFS transporter, NNP family, nitrate/nitrite transporter
VFQILASFIHRFLSIHSLCAHFVTAISTLFGWINLFARGIGGFFSDVANHKWGIPGRLGVQSFLLLMEGIFVIIFSQTHTLAGAIVVLIIFSFFVQSSEGSTFGIVPYVDQLHTGSVTGMVGAGGNVGAVCFGVAFRVMGNDKNALLILGGSAIVSSVLSVFIRIEGHGSLLYSSFGDSGSKAREVCAAENTNSPQEEA